MREVLIHDTLSGELRRLEPRQGSRVGIYACGPTTYGPIHVGNARPFVVFMLLRRFLAHLGYDPTLVMNITDVNDKIYTAADEAGETSAALAKRMIAGYVADTDALGLGRPDHEPLATATMDQIIGLIGDLVAAGHAYESSGDVYFAVRGFAGYGKLSNRSTEDMDQGEEAGAAELKRDPLDFALWKAAKSGEDTSWDSPWGKGRAGWHIECSAMAESLLGVDFEIHGGGSDLVFPHHENEIAQTEAARGLPLARIWMHNGMVQSGPGEKMSKSVGNIFLLAKAVSHYGAEAVISFLVSGHYRQPLVFSAEVLEAAQARNARLRDFFRAVERGASDSPAAEVTATRERFEAALAEDFNTPRAMAAVYELVGKANRESLEGAGDAVAAMLELVGLGSLADVAELDAAGDEAAELMAERERARAQGDFDRADAIRDRLASLGWDVRDSAEGPRLIRRV